MADDREYTVKADFPNQMKDVEVEIPGVGFLKNGESKKVMLTREKAEFLASAHGVVVTTEGGKAVKGVDFVASDEPVGPPMTEMEPGMSVTEATEEIGAGGGEK